VRTSTQRIAADVILLCAAGHTSVLAALAGFGLPIQAHPLQTPVSELLEPVLNCVVMSNAVHVYVNQADKGSFQVIEHQIADALELFPIFNRAHVMRTWAGLVDVAPDASPIIGHTPVDNLSINCGWAQPASRPHLARVGC
jgi:sarcosine oxidase, subunit beta